MNKIAQHFKVLSVYPTKRGFSFVVFDSPKKLQDWGNRTVGNDPTCKLTADRMTELLKLHRPDVLLLDDPSGAGALRSVRLARIAKKMRMQVLTVGAELGLVSRQNVRIVFAQAGALNKRDIAQQLAERYVALSTKPPRERKAWHAEDPRMNVFDAASRALTYYQMQNRLSKTTHGER